MGSESVNQEEHLLENADSATRIFVADMQRTIEEAEQILHREDAIRIFLGDHPTRARIRNAFKRFRGSTKGANITIARIRDETKDCDPEERNKLTVEMAVESILSPYAYTTRHGIKARVEHNCRCGVCEKAFERAMKACSMVVEDGASLADAANSVGCTRERVRQWLAFLFPGFSASARREEQAERRRRERERERNKVKSRCMICNKGVTRRNGRTCGDEECQNSWNIMAYHVDESRKERHKQFVAKSMLANSHNYTEHQIAYAKRILNGEVKKREGRNEWLVEGAKTFDIALRAYKDGAPLFDELPLQIQEQIREYVNGE